MSKLRYVLDMGFSNTSIYHKGLILKEPSLAVIRKRSGLELVAAGAEAYQLAGKLDEYSSFIPPVTDGGVVNVEIAALMLREFFSRVIPKRLFKGIEIYAAISAGLSIAEREALETAINKAGYKDVTLVESVLGLKHLVDKRGQTVIIFGGGTTEIGVINEGGIIAACSINLGGHTLDEKIAERVLDAYNLKISLRTAEKLKKQLGSLYDNDTSVMEIVGRDILSGSVRKEEISAESIKAPITQSIKTIIEVTESLITTIPQHMISEVTARGIYVAGGGADMRGLQDFMSRYLKIPVHCDKDPDTAVARGLYLL
ncbi:MAG: rod shape-determining protein [Clostridia bacterium]